MPSTSLNSGWLGSAHTRRRVDSRQIFTVLALRDLNAGSWVIASTEGFVVLKRSPVATTDLDRQPRVSDAPSAFGWFAHRDLRSIGTRTRFADGAVPEKMPEPNRMATSPAVPADAVDRSVRSVTHRVRAHHASSVGVHADAPPGVARGAGGGAETAHQYRSEQEGGERGSFGPPNPVLWRPGFGCILEYGPGGYCSPHKPPLPSCFHRHATVPDPDPKSEGLRLEYWCVAVRQAEGAEVPSSGLRSPSQLAGVKAGGPVNALCGV